MKFGFKIAMVLGLAGFGILTATPVLAVDDILLKSTSSKLCLNGHARGKDITAARCRTPFGAQRWSIDPDSGQIRHTRRNLCLAVSNSNRANGARVVLWPCNGATNQRWNLASAGPIKSILNGKCLDVSKHNRKSNLANVHMWDCHKGENQQWQQVVVKRSFKKKTDR